MPPRAQCALCSPSPRAEGKSGRRQGESACRHPRRLYVGAGVSSAVLKRSCSTEVRCAGGEAQLDGGRRQAAARHARNVHDAATLGALPPSLVVPLCQPDAVVVAIVFARRELGSIRRRRRARREKDRQKACRFHHPVSPPRPAEHRVGDASNVVPSRHALKYRLFIMLPRNERLAFDTNPGQVARNERTARNVLERAKSGEKSGRWPGNGAGRRAAAAIWGTPVVTGGSLTLCMIDVRRALGDGSRRLVRTVPGGATSSTCRLRKRRDSAARSPLGVDRRLGRLTPGLIYGADRARHAGCELHIVRCLLHPAAERAVHHHRAA